MIRRIAHSYRSSFSGLSKETWLLSVVMLINRASTMVVPFMSMYVTQSQHRSIAQAGLVITLFGVGSVIGSATGGYFIDKAGFRSVQIVATLAGGLLFMLIGQVNNFTAFCLLTVALSFVAEAFRPANYAAVSAYSTPENLTRSYSLNRLAMNLGWGLGIPIAGFLASVNYHLLFWVEGCAYLIIGIFILLFLPAAAGVPKEAGVLQTGALPPERKSNSPWKDVFLLRFLGIVTLYTTCFLLMFRLVPVYWKEQLHIGESRIGLLLGLNGIIIALFEMVLVRYWESRRTNMYYIIAGAVLTALGFAALVVPALSTLSIATLAVVLLTIGEMLAFPFINTVIMGRAKPENRGKYAAAYALSWSVAQIAGPGGGALVIERWGYGALWMILALLCLACALTFRILPEKA